MPIQALEAELAANDIAEIPEPVPLVGREYVAQPEPVHRAASSAPSPSVPKIQTLDVPGILATAR
jgi:hypothetical protein